MPDVTPKRIQSWPNVLFLTVFAAITITSMVQHGPNGFFRGSILCLLPALFGIQWTRATGRGNRVWLALYVSTTALLFLMWILSKMHDAAGKT